MTKRDPLVAARPKCYFCAKPLQPRVVSWGEDESITKTWGKPPKRVLRYGAWDGRFCSGKCAIDYALHHTIQQRTTPEHDALEVERARKRYEEKKARRLRKKFNDTTLEH
jgi:hypothetical protein